MNQEQFLEQIYPWIGGQSNVGRWQTSGDKLYITVKDRSMVDLASVRRVPGVEAAELGRSRLSITVQAACQEELHMAKKGNYDELAKKIIQLVGGESNIANVTHCITRLRFNLKDESKADTEAIRSTPGVVGVTSANGQYQVIIGAEVTQVYEKLTAQLHNLEGASAAPAQKEGSVVSRLIDTITGIFTPILPPLTAAGMLKAVLAILVAFKLVDSASSTYQVINFMADATFYFLPILLANSAAKKLGCNPYLAMMLGGIIIHPNFVSMVTASKETGEAITVFGLPIYNATYSSSVIPILLGVLLMSKVEPLANKFAPKAVRFFTAPLITMLVVGIATLCVLGPIGYVISNILASAINGLSAIAPALTPIGINNRMTIGFDTIIYPGQLASNIAQGAAALAVSFKTKNTELKELTSSTGITAVCGITEPVLYGVTMKIRTNMIAAMAGGGVGGFFMGLMNTKNYSGGSPGLLTLPSYIGLDAPMSNFYYACAGAAIAFVVGFVVSFILYKDPVDNKEKA